MAKRVNREYSAGAVFAVVEGFVDVISLLTGGEAENWGDMFGHMLADGYEQLRGSLGPIDDLIAIFASLFWHDTTDASGPAQVA